MLKAAFGLNVLILLPICWGLAVGAKQMDLVFGSPSTSRQILLCMYLTLLLLSLYLLYDSDKATSWAPVILGFQIIYKTLSLVLIEDKTVPVYWFNLGVAIFHSFTVYWVYFRN